MARERPGSLSWNPVPHGDVASCGWMPHVEMISHFEGKSGTFLSLLVLWELEPLPDFIGKLQQKKLEIVSSVRVLYSKGYTRRRSKPDYFQSSSALWIKTKVVASQTLPRLSIVNCLVRYCDYYVWERREREWEERKERRWEKRERQRHTEGERVRERYGWAFLPLQQSPSLCPEDSWAYGRNNRKET